MTRKKRPTVPNVQEGEPSLGSGLDEVGWLPRLKRDGQRSPPVRAVDTRRKPLGATAAIACERSSENIRQHVDRITIDESETP